MVHIPRLRCHLWRRYYLLACAHTVYGRTSSMAVNCGSYVWISCERMFYSHCASHLDGCSLAAIADGNELSRRLCEIQTTGELLNLVSVVEGESWTPELSSLLTERLVHTHYQSLRAVIPWLQEDASTASKQLRLSNTGKLQDAAAPIRLHSAYENWTSIVESTCTGYTPHQLASAVLSAVNLFVDLESSLMHRLLSETHRRLPDFTLTALAVFSRSLKALPGNNDIFVRSVMKHMQTLLTGVETVNASELLEIASVFANLRKFTSGEFRFSLVSWLLQVIQSNRELLLNPLCVRALFYLGYIQLFSDKHNSRRLIDMGVEICRQRVDQLSISNVAKMCILLQSCSRHNNSLRHVFGMLESRALDLLSDDCRLSDVIDLTNSLTKHTSQQVLVQFYTALHSRLINSDYIDIYSLSSVARALSRTQNVRPDLLSLLQHFVADQVDDIVPHVQLFSGIEKFVSRHGFFDKDLERRFHDQLLSYIRRNVDVSPNYCVSVVSAYLLPVISSGLPTSVFKQTISAVTNWRESALHRHSLRITSLRDSSSNRQLRQLNAALYQSLCKQLDQVDSLECLHTLASSLLLHSCQQHPIVTDHVMHMYQRYSSVLSDNVSAWKIAAMFSKLIYYLPSVYDDLVRYVVNTDSCNTETVV